MYRKLYKYIISKKIPILMMQYKSMIYIFLGFLCSHNDECAIAISLQAHFAESVFILFSCLSIFKVFYAAICATATCKLTQCLSCSHLSTGGLSVYISTTSTTSQVISWILTEGVVVTSYNISYINTDTQCFNDSDVITDIGANETMYTVTGLQEDTEYSISVTAMLSDGGTGEDNLTASTMATG